MFQHRALGRVMPQDCAKAARIRVSQDAMLKNQVDMIVTFQLASIRAEKSKISSHTQMDNQRTDAKIQQQIFAAPIYAGKPAPTDQGG